MPASQKCPPLMHRRLESPASRLGLMKPSWNLKWSRSEEALSACAFQIMELLMKGNKQRTQEPTAANQTSSRSHAVLQVAVRQQSRCRDVLQEVRFARLFMIDLAGSERAAQVRGVIRS